MMQVTEEDGGKLNAFAREPRMEVMDADRPTGRAAWMLIGGGTVLVLVLLAVAAKIS